MALPTTRSIVADMSGDCSHLHDSATRYDHAHKLLSFLLVCPECAIERVVNVVPYEPRFVRDFGRRT
jgi:hypothetical protein